MTREEQAKAQGRVLVAKVKRLIEIQAELRVMGFPDVLVLLAQEPSDLERLWKAVEKHVVNGGARGPAGGVL